MAALFEQIKAIVEAEVKRSQQAATPFLSNYKEEFYEFDKDTLNLHTQGGDCFVLELKGNGVGTNLDLVQGEPLVFSNNADDSLFYAIKCSDMGEGVVRPISYEKAQQIHKAHPKRSDRVARMTFSRALEKQYGLSLGATTFFRDFDVQADQDLAIRVTTRKDLLTADVTVLPAKPKGDTVYSNYSVRYDRNNFVANEKNHNPQFGSIYVKAQCKDGLAVINTVDKSFFDGVENDFESVYMQRVFDLDSKMDQVIDDSNKLKNELGQMIDGIKVVKQEYEHSQAKIPAPRFK
ncbi:MAG: hypothetical protein HAW67_05305 [Endozoicomonadaceae bacterium]|nr:hypothetical protein [Endozoicomonadaceae bacterium]